MTQSEEIMLQVGIKGKEGVVHGLTGFGRCKAPKMYWTEANNCTRKSLEKIKMEESQETPRPAGLAPF